MIQNAKVVTVDGKTTITANCVVTGKEYSVSVDTVSYLVWKGGGLAQHAFPYLSPDDREFLISGTSPEGWKQLFGE